MKFKLQRALEVSRWIFGPAALAFLVLAAIGSQAAFENVLSRASLVPMLTAVGLWAALHLLTPMFAWTVLREQGASVPYRTALRIHVGRLPARYLPGGIWHTVSRVVDLNRLGVTSAQLSEMVVLENVLPFAVAALLGGLCFALAGNAPLTGMIGASVGVALLAGTWLVLRYRGSRNRPGVGGTAVFRLSAIALLFWLVAASAFTCYWSAFPAPEVGTPLLKVYGAYLLAWATGFAMVFAPQGIGVFEAVITALLRGSLPFAGVVVLAAGFRAAVLAADLIAYAVFLLLRARARLGPSPG